MRGLAVIAMALVAAPAAAQPESEPAAVALERAREGQALADGGDFLGAVPLFKEALGLDPRPEYLCNIGIAYYKARDLPRAELFLRDCLDDGAALASSFLDSVREVIAVVEGKLVAGEFTPVELVLEPGEAIATISTFADDERITGSRSLWLPWGAHRLVVAADGHLPEQLGIELTGRDRVTIPVTLAPVPVPPVVEPPPKKTDVVVAKQVPPRERSTSRRTLAWLSTGAAIGFGVIGTALIIDASYVGQNAGELPPGAEWEAARDKARRLQSTSFVTFGIGGACALTAGYLWWRLRPGERTRLDATASGDGATIWMSGSF